MYVYMHILIMTFNKLNDVHISVFCSDNACLSLIKILWASWVQQLMVETGLFSGVGLCHHLFEDVTNSIWQPFCDIIKQIPCWTNKVTFENITPYKFEL